MKTMKNIAPGLLITASVFLSTVAGPAHAGDDPSIKGTLRQGIQASMAYFIEAKAVRGVLHLYDPVDGKLLKLTFKDLHKGIVKKGDFYVSCADFTDAAGHKYDVDLLVLPDDDTLKTVQAIVHSVDGKKRPYNLESK